MFYQIKMIRKRCKPPIWRRAYVPSNITFCQMAFILEELLELPKSDLFEFEFFQAKTRVIEWHEEDGQVTDYQYDYLHAPDTYVNRWFQNEEWFTFRMRSRINQRPVDEPEYRVEIEKALDLMMREEQRPVNFPVLCLQKSSENDPFWKRGAEINELLMADYLLEEREPQYQSFDEIRADVEEKHNGIGVSTTLVDRDIHNYESARSILHRLDKTEAPAEAFPESEGAISRNGSDETTETARSSTKTWERVKEERVLSSYPKQELSKFADDLGITLTAKRKDGMAYEIARYILKPEVMRGLLLTVTEEELDIFEHAIDQGWFRPGEEEAASLDPFYALSYIAVYSTGHYVVPEEVAEVYSILKRNGYRAFHKKAAWMYACLKAFDAIHMIAPEIVLYRMYRRQKSAGSSYDDFKELFEEIPDSVNPCCEVDGKIVSKAGLKEDLYQLAEEIQRDVDYYIPTEQEILSYAQYGYPKTEKAYQDLWRFFRDQLNVEEDLCSSLCMLASAIFAGGGLPPTIWTV